MLTNWNCISYHRASLDSSDTAHTSSTGILSVSSTGVTTPEPVRKRASSKEGSAIKVEEKAKAEEKGRVEGKAREAKVEGKGKDQGKEVKAKDDLMAKPKREGKSRDDGKTGGDGKTKDVHNTRDEHPGAKDGAKDEKVAGKGGAGLASGTKLATKAERRALQVSR